jgi:hypothetical protein
MDVTVNHPIELADYELSHVLDSKRDTVELNFVLRLHDSLCDVLSKILDMFEIVGNPRGADHFSQIAAYRLTPRNRDDFALSWILSVPYVYGILVCCYISSNPNVALGQRGDRAGNLLTGWDHGFVAAG